MNKVIQAREFLEARTPGFFELVCDTAIMQNGILHMASDCFMAGIPCEGDPSCLHIIFCSSELPALYRLLCALPYESVEWQRAFDHSSHYGMRRRSIKDWGRKLTLIEKLNKKDTEK